MYCSTAGRADRMPCALRGDGTFESVLLKLKLAAALPALSSLPAIYWVGRRFNVCLLINL